MYLKSYTVPCDRADLTGDLGEMSKSWDERLSVQQLSHSSSFHPKTLNRPVSLVLHTHNHCKWSKSQINSSANCLDTKLGRWQWSARLNAAREVPGLITRCRQFCFPWKPLLYTALAWAAHFLQCQRFTWPRDGKWVSAWWLSNSTNGDGWMFGLWQPAGRLERSSLQLGLQVGGQPGAEWLSLKLYDQSELLHTALHHRSLSSSSSSSLLLLRLAFCSACEVIFVDIRHFG